MIIIENIFFFILYIWFILCIWIKYFLIFFSVIFLFFVLKVLFINLKLLSVIVIINFDCLVLIFKFSFWIKDCLLSILVRLLIIRFWFCIERYVKSKLYVYVVFVRRYCKKIVCKIIVIIEIIRKFLIVYIFDLCIVFLYLKDKNVEYIV